MTTAIQFAPDSSTLTFFVQDRATPTGKWETIAAFMMKEAAEGMLKLMTAARRDNGYWVTPMGRYYRIVTTTGRMV